MTFLIYDTWPSSCTLSYEKQNVYILVHKNIQTQKKEKYKKGGCIIVLRTMSDIYDGALIWKNITATAVNCFCKNASSWLLDRVNTPLGLYKILKST